MVNDADKYREEDDKQRERVSSKNALESYCFNIKQTVKDEKVRTRSPKPTVKPSPTSAVKPSPGWMPTNSPKRKSSTTSSRKLKIFANQLLLNSMAEQQQLVEHPEQLVELLPVEVQEDLLSKKSTKQIHHQVHKEAYMILLFFSVHLSYALFM